MRQTVAAIIAGRMLTATFLVCVGILAVAYVNAQNLDVVYVPTPRETVDRMLQVTEVGSADFVIDLGSGDGRIAIAAGLLGARALGVDLDPARIRDAQLNAQRAGVTDRVTFRQQNLFETDLSRATVLTMYLLPSINVKLRPKILGLHPGTRVVSHDFTMGDWKSDLTETNNWRIHMWIVPARVAGKWQVRSGNRAFNLTIDQTYQEFRGMVSADGRTFPLRNTKLRAANIEFTVDLDGQPATLRGTVNGDRMQGRSASGTEWVATRL
jgi:SAM-dependent methyltransferase